MQEQDKNEVELHIRRILAQEAGEYREFLQRQFRFITWSIGVLLVVGGGLTTYFLGDSYQSTKEKMINEIDAKVMEYRIVDAQKKKIDFLLKNAVAKELKEPSTTKTINALIGSESKKIVIEEILEKTALSIGAVLAFDRNKCPSGWVKFNKAVGRTIIGAGPKTKETTERKVGEQHGKERHKLTLAELPKHDHNAKGALSGGKSFKGTGLAWYSYNNVLRIPTEGVDEDSKSPNFWSNGDNKSHNNMPPYVVLLYCKKG